MDPMDRDKVERFKARIGFDQRTRGAPAAAAAELRWPDPLTAPGVAGRGWRLAADTVWRDGDGNVREWVLRRDAETLMVLAFVSRSGEDGARRFFLERACNTMMLEVPYVPGPPDLGSLAVTSPHAGAPYLMWIFGACCVELKAVDSRLDLVAIARWLQSLVEAAPRTRGRAPAPDRVTISALRAVVGEALELRLEPADGSPAEDYLMELEYDRGELEVLSQNGLAARVCGLRPGPAVLIVHGVRRATLAASSHRLALSFDAGALR